MEEERLKELEVLEASTPRSTDLDKPITIQEVKQSLRMLKNNKAAGEDMVLNELL